MPHLHVMTSTEGDGPRPAAPGAPATPSDAAGVIAAFGLPAWAEHRHLAFVNGTPAPPGEATVSSGAGGAWLVVAWCDGASDAECGQIVLGDAARGRAGLS